jgi:deoxycytidylate deaminase
MDALTRLNARMKIAARLVTDLAELSTCKRMQTACAIIDPKLAQIYSMGYNGQPAGLSNSGCTGKQGDCGCNHAEQNAFAKLRTDKEGLTMVILHNPCKYCAGLIITSGQIAEVLYLEEYRCTIGLDRLMKAGIRYRRMRI